MGLLRWMRRRHWCCKTCMFILVAMVTFGTYIGYYLHHENTCSEQESQKLIFDLCTLYRNRHVAGSMCSALCDDNELTYEKCTNYRNGKKVLFMTCRGCEKNRKSVRTVFKTKTSLEERDTLTGMLYWHDDSGRSRKEFISMIEMMVKNTYQSEFGLNVSKKKDVLSYTWGWDFNKYVDENKNYQNATMVAAESIWSLSQQSEYSLLQALRGHAFIPKVYGTCGPAYFVEFTETLNNWEYGFLSDWKQPWKRRVNLALALIELMKRLDTELHQPLHLCDVKADNFGLRDNGEVTLIDIDCAMYDDKLNEQFFHSNCTSHDDCDFFDCRGFCDIKTKKCVVQRTNNNMQSLCEDVFIGYFSKFPTGLLRDPPPKLKVELFSVLQECAHPEPGSTTLRHTSRAKTSDETTKKLEKVLRESLHAN